MQNVVLLLVTIFTLSFTASAQFSFTSKAGEKFTASSAPQKTESRGGGFMIEFYYTVEGSDLVAYEVGKSDGEIRNTIQVTRVPIDQIIANSFKVQKSGSGCYLQTGTPFTKLTHGSNFNPDDKYSGNNLQLDFKNCDDANAFRTKVLGDAADDLDLGDLDLDLEDKSKSNTKDSKSSNENSESSQPKKDDELDLGDLDLEIEDKPQSSSSETSTPINSESSSNETSSAVRNLLGKFDGKEENRYVNIYDGEGISKPYLILTYDRETGEVQRKRRGADFKLEAFVRVGKFDMNAFAMYSSDNATPKYYAVQNGPASVSLGELQQPIGGVPMKTSDLVSKEVFSLDNKKDNVTYRISRTSGFIRSKGEILYTTEGSMTGLELMLLLSLIVDL